VDRLVLLLEQNASDPSVPIYVNTSRATLDALAREGRLDLVHRFSVRPVVDTCTYLTPILDPAAGAVMTNSGKWAHYAPGNLGFDVAFGELEDCVASASAGRVVRVDGSCA